MIVSSPVSCTVFISYSRKDTDWVREGLLPHLEEAGVSTLIDEDDFELGTFTSRNIADAVESSDHVIAVVTKDWLESAWCNLELSLQTTKDPAGALSRLIPLVFVSHEDLPSEVAVLTYADFRSEASRAKGMSRLLKQLGASQQQVDAANAQFAKKGLAELRLLLKSGAVQNAVGDFGDKLEELQTRIGLSKQYKLLHDHFQKAESHFKLAYKEWKTIRENQSEVDDCSWDELACTNELLSDEIQMLLEIAHEFLRPDQCLWSKRLDRARKEMTEAIHNCDLAKLRLPFSRLRDSIARELFQLNKQLVDIAGTLDLYQVVEILQRIDKRIDDDKYVERAIGQLFRLRNGIAAFRGLNDSLRLLVEQHNILQGLTNELLRYNFLEGGRSLNAEEIVADWPTLKEMLAEFGSDDDRHHSSWLKKLESVSEQLSVACVDGQGRPERDSQRRVRRLFNSFNGALDIASNRVDTDLKKLFEELQQVGDELEGFLGDMKNEQ